MATSNRLGRTSLFDCTGLVAVVTGGGTGLGLAMARALALNGATVYILGRRLAKLEAAAASCSNLTTASVIPLQCDTTSKDSLAAAAAHIAAQSGYVNLLIANAGIQGPHNRSLLPRDDKDPRGPLTIQKVQRELWNVPVKDMTETYDVNVVGTMYTAIAFLELLDRGNAKANVRQKSQILITSSIGGFHRSWPQIGLAYTTSKAAVNLLVKGLASFLGQWKIRANGIAPGIFPSELTTPVFGDEHITREGALPASINPLRRAGTEEEIAGTVLYFASEAGAYCSGTIHIVDGGRLGLQPGATY